MRNNINFAKLTKKYNKDLINSIKDFVAINSVYDPSTVDEENPFGVGVSRALNYFATVAYYDGFSVKNYSNKIIEAIILGVVCYITLIIFDIPYKEVVSVFIGVTDVIPFFGPFIGTIPSAILIFTISPIKCLIFVIIILVCIIIIIIWKLCISMKQSLAI